jgi:UPF0755 protein
MSHRVVLERVPDERVERKRRRRRSGIAVLLSFLLVGGLVTGAFLGLRTVIGGILPGEAPDYSGEGTGQVLVEVTSGQTSRSIGVTLEEEGVVKSADAFAEAARDDARSLTIQPGFYALRREMKASSALALLLDPASRAEGKVVLPEGTRLSRSLELIADGSDVALADLQAASQDAASLGLPPWAGNNVEGFIFPATYPVPPEASAQSVLRQTTERFSQAAQTLALEQRAQNLGYTPYEIMTIASMIQAEARERDFGKVARVIYNRLEKGQALQIDATVNYALNKSELGLTSEDLEVDSPYNTYQVTGLPPTPINSPGEDAIEAALSPEPGDWIYYVTVDPGGTGETRFTASYEEFLRWKEELKRNT